MASMRPGRKEQHRACERETNADSEVFPWSRDGLGFLVFNLVEIIATGKACIVSLQSLKQLALLHILGLSCSSSMEIIPVPAQRSCTPLFSLSMMAHWITGMRFFSSSIFAYLWLPIVRMALSVFLEAHATLKSFYFAQMSMCSPLKLIYDLM